MSIAKALRYLLAGLLIVLAFAPGSAGAAQPACGDTVKHDVELKRNLDCRGQDTDGLVVGAKDVTIDLNGHSILGTSSYGKTGVYNDGFRRMTVKDGLISGFDGQITAGEAVFPSVKNVRMTGDGQSRYGLSLVYTYGARAVNTTTKNLEEAILVEHGEYAKIKHAEMTGVDTGIYALDEAGARISNVVVHPWVDGTGVTDTGGAGNRYTRVRVNDTNAYYGFQLSAPSNVRIDRSVASHTQAAGVYIGDNSKDDGHRATVTDTTANGNGTYGMFAQYKGTRAAGNSAQGNTTTDCVRIKCA